MSGFLDKLSHFAQFLVAFCVLLSFISCVGAFFWLTFQGKDLLPGLKEVLLVLIGVLAGAFKDVVGYYVGSSLSSAKKDATIASTVKP